MTSKSQKYLFPGVKYTILLLVIVISIYSCKKPPNYPDEPEIAFESLEFNDGALFDTIDVVISFTDGNGDLGLEDDNTNNPFHEYLFVYNSSGDKIEPSDTGALSFNLIDYEIFEVDTLIDTFQVIRNPYFYNYIVDYYVENSAGEFIFQDLEETCKSSLQICQSFNGRFPPLSNKDYEEPIEGTIKYAMQSTAWPNARIKFKISIYDRALNLSNVVETSVLDLR